MNKKLLIGLFLVGCVVLGALATGIIAIVTQNPQDVYYAATQLCIQQGTLSTAANGTVTQAFPVAYNAAAPRVYVTAVNASGTNSCYVSSVTTSNFIFTSGTVAGANTNAYWLSIGAP